jgi:hypothetical protein
MGILGWTQKARYTISVYRNMNMPLSSDAELIIRLKILIGTVSKERLKEIIDQMTSIST